MVVPATRGRIVYREGFNFIPAIAMGNTKKFTWTIFLF